MYPSSRKFSHFYNFVKEVPNHRIEGFSKVNFNEHRRLLASLDVVQSLSSGNEIFKYLAPLYKGSLMVGDDFWQDLP